MLIGKAPNQFSRIVGQPFLDASAFAFDLVRQYRPLPLGAAIENGLVNTQLHRSARGGSPSAPAAYRQALPQPNQGQLQANHVPVIAVLVEHFQLRPFQVG